MPRPYPELFILRHGQTEWNVAARLQGHRDSPLTPLGRQQAAAQNHILKRAALPEDTVFHCSPLGRTRATARLALAGLTDAPLYDDRLKEVSLGAFEGHTLDDLHARWPDLMAATSPLSWHYRAPGGEGLDAFRSRILHWLDTLDRPAVVVTHGIVSAALRAIALGHDIGGPAPPPRGQGIVYHVKDGAQRCLNA